MNLWIGSEDSAFICSDLVIRAEDFTFHRLLSHFDTLISILSFSILKCGTAKSIASL